MTHWTTSPGDTIKDQFSAFEDDGVTKRSGLTIAGGDFAVTVWKDCVVDPLTVTITEIGASGEYCLEYTPPTAGTWKVQIHIDFSDDIMCSTASVGTSADLSGVLELLERVLGLLHMNSMVDRQEFDPANQLLKARLRHFDSPTNLPSSQGGNETVGLLHQYEIEAKWEAANREVKYAVKTIL